MWNYLFECWPNCRTTRIINPKRYTNRYWIRYWRSHWVGRAIPSHFRLHEHKIRGAIKSEQECCQEIGARIHGENAMRPTRIFIRFECATVATMTIGEQTAEWRKLMDSLAERHFCSVTWHAMNDCFRAFAPGARLRMGWNEFGPSIQTGKGNI